MNELEIISYLNQNIDEILKDSGISIKTLESESRLSDIILELNYGKKSVKLLGEICTSLHFSIFYQKVYQLKKLVDYKINHYPILIGPKLSPEKQKICKDNGLFYLDLSGNIYIKLKDLLIDRQGNHKIFNLKEIHNSPFVDKASLILRILLEKPDQARGIREIASIGRISPGWVSAIAKTLVELNYLIRVKGNKVKLVHPEYLLKDWVEFYKFKNNHILQYYYHAKEGVQIINKLKKMKLPEWLEYALSVQGGAYLVAPHAVFQEVHIYLPGNPGERLQAISFWEKELKLKKMERNGNLVLMEPYYCYSVFFGKQKIKGLHVVSNVQLYLDLMKYPLRGEEQAEHLYNKKLKPLFEKI